MAQPKKSDDGNPVDRYKQFYESHHLWWRARERCWWIWEVVLSKLTGRQHPMPRIIDRANAYASRGQDKYTMKMSKTSQSIIDAIRNDEDPNSTAVSESTILGRKPIPPEEGASSVSLVTINRRGELTVTFFKNAQQVTEMCAALQAASDAIFGDGDMQPEIVLDS